MGTTDLPHPNEIAPASIYDEAFSVGNNLQHGFGSLVPFEMATLSGTWELTRSGILTGCGLTR